MSARFPGTRSPPESHLPQVALGHRLPRVFPRRRYASSDTARRHEQTRSPCPQWFVPRRSARLANRRHRSADRRRHSGRIRPPSCDQEYATARSSVGPGRRVHARLLAPRRLRSAGRADLPRLVNWDEATRLPHGRGTGRPPLFRRHQPPQRLKIPLPCPLDHLVRQPRTRRLLIPRQRQKIVAHELLVIARR